MLIRSVTRCYVNFRHDKNGTNYPLSYTTQKTLHCSSRHSSLLHILTGSNVPQICRPTSRPPSSILFFAAAAAADGQSQAGSSRSVGRAAAQLCGRERGKTQQRMNGDHCCQIAKFDAFLSLDCARMEGVGGAIQGKEGIKFCSAA